MADSPSHPALAHLSQVYAAVVPELAELALPAETRADCASCVMVARAPDDDASHPRWFRDDARCCTYHPRLPNYLVGRVLVDGGVGAERVRRRMELRAGVSPYGISPSEAWLERYRATAVEAFGRDLDLRCPYWVGGAHACGIWKHRTGVCRTWHCRHVEGERGLKLWVGLRVVLEKLEDALANLCVKTGQPPDGRVPLRTWARWYVWCAKRVEILRPSEIEALRRAALDGPREALHRAARATVAELPEVVAPAAREVERIGDRVRLVGYSRRDDALVPRSVFALLSRLDGVRPWREALAEAEAEAGPLGEALVRELWRVGVLVAPTDDWTWEPPPADDAIPDLPGGG